MEVCICLVFEFKNQPQSMARALVQQLFISNKIINMARNMAAFPASGAYIIGLYHLVSV